MNEITFDLLTEIKTFIKFFIESFFVLIIVQLVSDKIDNDKIEWYKEAKIAFLIAIILYVTKCINKEMCDNISQGFAYGISGVFLSKYVNNYM